MKTPLSIYALSGLVGAIGVAPLAAGQSQAPVLSPSASPATFSLVDAPRLPGSLDAAPATWSGSPLDIECGSLELTQSTNPILIAASSVWCGTLDFNSETRLARAFTAPHDLSLECVTFAVRQNTGADWPCTVRVLLGGTAAPYSSLTLLTETTLNIPTGTDRELFTAEMPALSIPSGTDFIIELVTPTRDPSAGGDGALLALGFNSAGESAPTYIYAEACGLSEYQTLASVGFPNRHLALSLGVDQGLVSPTLGGFPISIIGGAVLSELEGKVFAIGDGGPDPVGLSIAYGDLTSGSGASFSVLSDNELGATVAMVFHGATTTDRFVFRDGPTGNDSAILDLEFTDPTLIAVDIDVYNNGEFVGTLKNQVSGGVSFTDPGNLWKWVEDLIGLLPDLPPVEIGCWEKTTETAGGDKTTEGVWLIRTGASIVTPSGGGPGLLGNEIQIKPAEGTLSLPEPPVSIDIITTGLRGLAVDIATHSPLVKIGDAETKPRPKSEGRTTEVGVSFQAIKEKGIQWMHATDLTGDGIADLSIIPIASSLPPDPDAGVMMELGGAVSATIGMSVVSPAPTGACMMIIADWPVIPPPYISFDPWLLRPELVAISPDFSAVGTGRFTLRAYDAAGAVAFEETGMQGVAGGSTAWPNKCGKLGGETPCFTVCYPDLTTFRTVGGQTFEVREIRILAEEAGPAPLIDTLRFTATNMGELQLFDPVVELPEFGNPCPADCDGSGSLDFFDFLCFQNAFSSGDPYADCDQSGTLDFFDFLCFQNEFAAGCP